MAILTVGFNPAIDRILECPGFHVGGHQQARQIARLASGKAANVSRALAHLGTDSIATGFIGALELPFFHDQLMATASKGKILCHFIAVAGSTRENVSILDPQRRGGETHIRDRGFTVQPAEMQLLEDRIRQDLKAGDYAVFSGSLCQGLPDRYFSKIMDLCATLGARVVVDTNGDPLKEAVARKIWMLKPNLEELGQVLGRDIPNAASAIRDAASQLLASAEHILVSRGRNGAVLLTREGAMSARSLANREAIRTVTCGDHLLAGFVADRAAGNDVEHSLRTATALATARALSPQLDAIDPDIYRQALQGVEIEKI